MSATGWGPLHTPPPARHPDPDCGSSSSGSTTAAAAAAPAPRVLPPTLSTPPGSPRLRPKPVSSAGVYHKCRSGGSSSSVPEATRTDSIHTAGSFRGSTRSGSPMGPGAVAGRVLAHRVSEKLKRQRTPRVTDPTRRGSPARRRFPSLRQDVYPILRQAARGGVSALLQYARIQRPVRRNPADLLSVEQGHIVREPPAGAPPAVGVLRVEVLEGSCLTKPDAYVVASVGHNDADTCHTMVAVRTHVIEGSCDPQWRSAFNIPVCDPIADVVLHVRSCAAGTSVSDRDPLIGRAVISLAQLPPRVRCGMDSTFFWLELAPAGSGLDGLSDKYVLGNSFAARSGVSGVMLRPPAPLGVILVTVSLQPLSPLLLSYTMPPVQRPQRPDFDVNLLFRDFDRFRRVFGAPALLTEAGRLTLPTRAAAAAAWAALCCAATVQLVPFVVVALLVANGVAMRFDEHRCRVSAPREGGTFIFDDDNPEEAPSTVGSVKIIMMEWRGMGVLRTVQESLSVWTTRITRAQHALSFDDPAASLCVLLLLLLVASVLSQLMPLLHSISGRLYCAGIGSAILLLSSLLVPGVTVAGRSSPRSSPAGSPSGQSPAASRHRAPAGGIRAAAGSMLSRLAHAAHRLPSDLEQDHRWVCAAQRSGQYPTVTQLYAPTPE
eukprot:TRINITY_DN3597_c2_g1_i2.p1 TRINITY_DN3597_c2_g1~~TRINITY_DN3597_c2_g1_i2.p1  ORF type:complete len:661 (+),score=175.34 TRINITY_DN3597_c2_g1_i2:52-2034(+)